MKKLLIIAAIISFVGINAASQNQQNLDALREKLKYQQEQLAALQKKTQAINAMPAGAARDQAAQDLRNTINQRRGKVAEVTTEATAFKGNLSSPKVACLLYTSPSPRD